MHFRHLDVGFTYPDVVTDIKGVAVLHIKGNMSWVHTVVIQVGFYLLSDRVIQAIKPQYERNRKCVPMVRTAKYMSANT